MKNIDLSLYLVTDNSDDEGKFLKTIEEAILGGVTVVQIREKTAETLDFYNLALKVKEITTKYGKMFEIYDDLNNLITTYSHGMKQKLAIISAFLHNPKLLILDEPFVGLDPKAVFLVKKAMTEFCENGGAIFFSTHVLEVAEKLCNKLAIIKEGKLIVSGLMEDVTKDASLEEVFMENSSNE